MIVDQDNYEQGCNDLPWAPYVDQGGHWERRLPFGSLAPHNIDLFSEAPKVIDRPPTPHPSYKEFGHIADYNFDVKIPTHAGIANEGFKKRKLDTKKRLFRKNLGRKGNFHLAKLRDQLNKDISSENRNRIRHKIVVDRERLLEGKKVSID